MDINHKDSVRDNCCVENLEWVDHPTNMRHGKLKGNFSKKLTANQRLEIQRRYAAGESFRKIAAAFGIAVSTTEWIVKKWRPDDNLRS